MFGLLPKSWRRWRWSKEPFPVEWTTTLKRYVPGYIHLSTEEGEKLRQLTRIFVREKYWEGCGGFNVTDEVKVTIAGTACLLLLGFESHVFDQLLTVLVYPTAYLAEQKTMGPGGVQTEGREPRLGEAWNHGPVILSWDAVCEPSGQGHNVVIHEFAHCLDLEEGTFNGTPLLADEQVRARWHDVMGREYSRLQHRRSFESSLLIDDYAATNRAEFFAVTSELFFTRPTELLELHAEVYSVLADFYRQDPAARNTYQRDFS